MSGSADNYARVHEVLAALRDLPIHQLAEQLHALCGTDAALRDEVLELLVGREFADRLTDAHVASVRAQVHDLVENAMARARVRRDGESESGR